MQSSPGIPYNKMGPTNADVLGWDGFQFDYYRKMYMWSEVQKILEGKGPEFYIKVFVKPEPHKVEKLEQHRERLIMACPLSYQIVWQMLFAFQNDLEIEKSYHIPSQQGIVIPHGGWKLYYQQWKKLGYDVGLDKRAWDWCFPFWLLMADLQFRTRMMRCRSTEAAKRWEKLAYRMYILMFRDCKLVLDDGRVFQQLFGGIMKSGCVNTVSTNSHGQQIIHILACEDQKVPIYPLPAACGDDTLQRKAQAVALDIYARYGAIVKSASEGLEFVGHEFTTRGPIPLYHGKHVCKFRTVPDKDLADYLDSMLRMYCKNDQVFPFWMYVTFELGYYNLVKSRMYYTTWMDVPE